MNKILLSTFVISAAVLAACGRNDVPPQPQVVYQQPPQVVYQQQPVQYAPQPSSDHTLAAGVVGAAVGAAAATAYHNSKNAAPAPQYSAGTPKPYGQQPATVYQPPKSNTQAVQLAKPAPVAAPAPKPVVATPKPVPAPKPVFAPSKVVAPRTSNKGK